MGGHQIFKSNLVGLGPEKVEKLWLRGNGFARLLSFIFSLADRTSFSFLILYFLLIFLPFLVFKFVPLAISSSPDNSLLICSISFSIFLFQGESSCLWDCFFILMFNFFSYCYCWCKYCFVETYMCVYFTSRINLSAAFESLIALSFIFVGCNLGSFSRSSILRFCVWLICLMISSLASSILVFRKKIRFNVFWTRFIAGLWATKITSFQLF